MESEHAFLCDLQGWHNNCAVFAGALFGFCMENQVPMCRLKNHTFGYLNNYLWTFILQPRMYHVYLPRMPEFMW